jgi:hypothetical protein
MCGVSGLERLAIRVPDRRVAWSRLYAGVYFVGVPEVIEAAPREVRRLPEGVDTKSILKEETDKSRVSAG